MDKWPSEVYRFDEFQLDVAERLLLRSGRPVPVQPKVFDTLCALVKHSGHLVEKDDLMRVVWPDTFVEEGNLTRNISTLREALGEKLKGRRYIETVPKRGYRFVGQVCALRGEDGGPEARQATAPSNADALDAAEDHAGRYPRRPAAGDRRAAEDAWTIVVLPFRALGTGEQDELLKVGMADALITRLSSIKRVVVRPTSAVLKYADWGRDPLAAGSEQKGDAVLDGCVQQAGEQIRLTVRLLNVADGRALWAGTFDEKFTNIFALQDAISRRVLAELMLKLTGDEQRRLAKRYTENTEAYQLYLKGRYHLNKYTEGGLRQGIEFFKRAIDLDPAYALAYAGMADAYHWLSSMYVPSREMMPKAKAAALRALEIDANFAEAHVSLALVLSMYEWRWAEAEGEYKRALALNPNYATAHHWYGRHLALTGRLDEGLAELRRAQVLDPLSPLITVDVAWPSFFARRYEEAIKQFRKALEIDRNFMVAHWVIGWAHEEQGAFAEAIADYQRALSIEYTPLVATYLGHAYARTGNRVEAQRILRELEVLSKATYVNPPCMAALYAGLDDVKEAAAWLERGFNDHNEMIIWFKFDYRSSSLRAAPRFREIMQHIDPTSFGYDVMKKAPPTHL